MRLLSIPVVVSCSLVFAACGGGGGDGSDSSSKAPTTPTHTTSTPASKTKPGPTRASWVKSVAAVCNVEARRTKGTGDPSQSTSEKVASTRRIVAAVIHVRSTVETTPAPADLDTSGYLAALADTQVHETRYADQLESAPTSPQTRAEYERFTPLAKRVNAQVRALGLPKTCGF
jgi:hypothetical protein